MPTIRNASDGRLRKETFAALGITDIDRAFADSQSLYAPQMMTGREIITRIIDHCQNIETAETTEHCTRLTADHRAWPWPLSSCRTSLTHCALWFGSVRVIYILTQTLTPPATRLFGTLALTQMTGSLQCSHTRPYKCYNSVVVC